MLNFKSLKFTVKCLSILMSIYCTQSFAQLAPVGMEARLVTFFKGDAEKNQGLQNVKASNEAWLRQKEFNKHWNTTSFQNNEASAPEARSAFKMAVRSITTPYRNDIRETVNNSEFIEDLQDMRSGEAAQGQAQAANNPQKADKIMVKWNVQAEKLRGRFSAQYKDLSTEANLAVNGKREVASSHNLSDLGLTTRISYRFDTESTVTTLDKTIVENVSTRVTHTMGSQSESRAEIVYSQSF